MNIIIRNVKRVELNTKIEIAFLNTRTLNLMENKCLCCNKNDQKITFDENLKIRFLNTYKFSNHGINKFILLLQKGV